MEVARSYIIGAGVAQDVLANVFLSAHFAALFADDHCQLTFKIHALGNFRTRDFFLGRNDGGWRFEKNQDLFRDFIAQFFGMVGIVASDTDNLRGLHWREQ